MQIIYSGHTCLSSLWNPILLISWEMGGCPKPVCSACVDIIDTEQTTLVPMCVTSVSLDVQPLHSVIMAAFMISGLCHFVHACMCSPTRVQMHTEAEGGGRASRSLLISVFYFETRSLSLWTWSFPILLDQLTRSPRTPLPCLCPLIQELQVLPCHTFAWVLKIQTRVLMLTWQVPSQLSHLSSPPLLPFKDLFPQSWR